MPSSLGYWEMSVRNVLGKHHADVASVFAFVEQISMSLRSQFEQLKAVLDTPMFFVEEIRHGLQSV